MSEAVNDTLHPPIIYVWTNPQTQQGPVSGGWNEDAGRNNVPYVRLGLTSVAAQPAVKVKPLVAALKSLADRVQIEGDCNGVDDETWQALADLRAALAAMEGKP